jgi:hypothetical protein
MTILEGKSMKVEMTDEQAQLLTSLLQAQEQPAPAKLKRSAWSCLADALILGVLLMALGLGVLRAGEWLGFFGAGDASQQVPTAAPAVDTPRRPDAQSQAPVTINVMPAPTAAPVPAPDAGSSDPALPIGERPNLNPGPVAVPPLETSAQPAPVARERAAQHNRPGGRTNQNAGPGAKP